MNNTLKSIKGFRERNGWEHGSPGLPKTFLNYGASLGIEWNKVEDSHLRLNEVKSNKGFDFVIAQNDVEFKKRRGRSNSWYETIRISGGDCLLVLQDGKPLWYQKVYKNHLGSHINKVNGVSRMSDSARKTSRNTYGGLTKTWGSQQYAMQSINAIKTAVREDGLKVKYLHLVLCNSESYMSGLTKLKERSAYKRDNLKWMSEDDLVKEFQARIEKQYKSRLNDLVTIRKKFNEARLICISIINSGTFKEQSRYAGMLRNLIKDYLEYKDCIRKDERNSFYEHGLENKAKSFQQKYLDICKNREHWNWSRSGYFGA